MKFHKFFSASTLFFFAFFIIIGNLLRLIDFGFYHSILVTEFVLYFISIFCVYTLRNSFRFAATISLFILSSSIFGALYNGFYFPSILYAVRLVGMILSGIVIGKLIFNKYGNSLSDMSRYFERVYLCNILLGLLIYLCFPNSTVLWQFLALYGIQFNGDPHTGRFVSTYLDPNYFGAIASIPLMLSYNVYQNHAKKKGGWKIVLIFLVAIMTLSRSGIMTLLLIISWIFFHKFLKVTYFAIKTKSIMVFFILLLVFSGLAIANSSSIIYFFDRSIHMNSDPSALGRLHSFQWGLNLISEHPLLGIGYNNLNLYLNDPIKGRTAIDSSLILTIISFGIPLASFLLSAILIWAIWVLMRLKSLGREYSTFCFFFKSMFFYLFVCIFFTSHFNNLLYYPFWLIPIISIFSYLMCCLKEIDQKKFFISSGVC